MSHRIGRGVGALLAAVSTAHGAISLDAVTWESGTGDVLGWFSQDSVATSVTSPSTGGSGNSGYLLMHFDPGDPVPQADVLATTDPSLTGNYAQLGAGLGVRFSFLGYTSSVQSVYFESSVAGGSRWARDIVPAGHAWEDWTFNLGTASGWTALPGSVNTDYLLALQQVDLIGISLSHINDGAIGFDYGLDNWQLFVPEPGEVAVLVMALLSLAFVFRRQLMECVTRRRPVAESQA